MYRVCASLLALWILLLPGRAHGQAADAGAGRGASATERAGADPGGAASNAFIPPGREAAAQALIADVGFARDLPGGFRFESIAIGQQTVEYVLVERATMRRVGSVWLRPRELAAPGDALTRSFAVRVEPADATPAVAAALRAAAASVAAHDDGEFFSRSRRAAAPGGPVMGNEGAAGAGQFLPRQAAWVFGSMALWALALWARDRRRKVGGPRLVASYKATHLLPAAIQLTIFTYWSLYWPVVREQLLVLIPMELAFAYGFDFLLAWSLGRKWEASFAVVPVVLSTNLFIWFPIERAYLYFVLLAIALGAKALIRRGGRHVFNPSAFGAAVVGVLCMTLPQYFRYTDISRELNLPPNMLEVMFLLTLVPQVYVRTALVTLGACLMQLAVQKPLMHALWPQGLPWPFWPAWFLAITLFATDPATLPRTPVGRLLFGAWVGFGIELFAGLFNHWVGGDYFAKVVPIPIGNALVPWFDAVGEWAEARAGGWRLPALADRALAGAWVVLFLANTAMEPRLKAESFDGRLQAEVGAQRVVREGGQPATCARNPAFCTPFSFGEELHLWRR